MPARHRPRPFRTRSSGKSTAYFPFGCLPIEMLQEIFSWCLTPAPSPSAEHTSIYHSADLQGFTKKTAPLLLCQVCRCWRQAVLSFPSLWTSLDVYVSMGKARPSLPLAKLWLARSGALPLSLALFQQNESNDNRIAAGEIIDLYKRYIHRWCNIQFDLTGPRYSRLLTSEQRSAPMLKQFRMQTSYRVYEEEEKDLFGIFDSVPRLSNLYVSRIPDLDLSGESAIPIPWRQLVSLSLDYVPSVGTTLRILEKCPNVTDCTFKVDSRDGPLLGNPIYRELTSLTINIGHEQLAAFLEHVSIPTLQQLTFYVRGPLDQYRWPQIEFEEFLERSACKILQFEIHDTGMRSDQFAACLRNPHLQMLEMIIVEDRRDWTWDPFVTDLAVDLLTCSPFLNRSKTCLSNLALIGNPPGDDSGSVGNTLACLLPHLESLTFRGSCLWTADGAVADMVESRWRFHCNAVRRLRRVELEMLSSHVEDFRRLKEFRSEGLELNLLFR